jgi:hypothetical protein
MVLPQHEDIRQNIKKTIVEKRKKEQLVKAELKAEMDFAESQRKVLKTLNKKMNDDLKKGGSNKNNDDAKRDGRLPHQYPKDKCIYQSSQSNLKKTMCGAPTEINIRNGINIFEIPLEAAYLDPNVMNSKNFAYGITDRCGRLQNYLTVSIRDPEYLGSINGRYLYTLPKLVGELDCYNHDCQVFMCNQLTGMASVISGNLYIYRKVGWMETNKTRYKKPMGNEFVAEYEINGKGSTFSIDFVRHPIIRAVNRDGSLLEMKENLNNQKLCTIVKKLLIKHPDASEDDVSIYLHEEYDMTENEVEEVRKNCNAQEANVVKETQMKKTKAEQFHSKGRVDSPAVDGKKEESFQHRHHHEWLSRAQEC